MLATTIAAPELGNESLSDSPTKLWSPSNVESTHMYQFMAYVNQNYGLAIKTYPELYDWSCTATAEFWSAVWRYADIQAHRPALQVLDTSVPMGDIPEWFQGARLNFAENALRWNDNHPAIICCGEHRLDDDRITRLTHRQLRELVAHVAAALRRLGVTQGDRVAGYLPNAVEAVAVMLAAASLGAIWCSTSPDFGTIGVLDRFSQIKPKVLFSVNAIVYNDKVYDHLAKLRSVTDGLSDLEHTVVIPFVSNHPALPNDDVPGGYMTWGTFLNGDSSATSESVPPLTFTSLPFNHPLYILFSSGTTGLPKCLVHSAGGMLIQHLKEHIIHGNMRRSDVLLQYTTTGWMMWNWMVSALAVGATIALYDGSPFKPAPSVLWSLIERFGVTMYGTSAKYIQSLQDANYHPRDHHNLSALHSIYSTGSPLNPESYDFVYEHIKPDLCLGSITGGTDICSLFAAHNTALPVYRGEIQCRGLGMAVEAWNAAKQPVYNESGDLVCTRPFPCMPVYFWNDTDGRRYRRAYFDHYPEVWYHGDFVWINRSTGGVVMLGRSDGTLNPAGVRFGSAELYNIVDSYPEILDSLAVGQKCGDDERVVLFLKMNAGQVFSDTLVGRLKSHIRTKLSPRHVPSFILEIPEIPYTINGKKVEIIVKKIISHQAVVPSATLANPECLAHYRNIAVLQ
ncbi:hypothetical protein H4R33_005367 [Dimargaris cristalligena]|uniref:Acetoacetyl-CoA synthetase n=1 Tax=Dimargaris cristalligena TaxID=215637 RepID=A0A4V1J4U7_9FUNG|nr:hypothetical protein H4R33_005367 [Dimargaris cristalligena]RKP36799.1 acetoacetyl-CoA synthetase [Dimargaris cristalligena]|eukprot:RKP36799.1 acetoacetyl-CoA synthetase [Dimargaris cristalligena]